MANSLKIVITMGDPVGIGPEIIVKTSSPDIINNTIVIGDSGLLERELKRSGSKFCLQTINSPKEFREGHLNIISPIHLKESDIIAGKPTNKTAEASLSYIDKAIELALNQEVSAIVTGPVNKNSLSRIEKNFAGHTEYIAEKTASKNPVMLMVSPKMKVIPLTTHIPLEKVKGRLTEDLITETLEIANLSLKKYFGLDNPKIAVTGLNPHAGEEIFGIEESEIIKPAILKAQGKGINVSGPHPADSIFSSVIEGSYDLVLAMYHDQALIPIKTTGFKSVVNVTLGIPIIRTSVGHGIAYDIAGKNIADSESLLRAIELAILMSEKSKGL